MRRVITSRDAEKLGAIRITPPPKPFVVEEVATKVAKRAGPPPITPPKPTELKAAEVPPDDYPSRVVKYIPAEIVAVFVAIDGILKVSADVPASLYWVVFVVLLVLTALYTWRFTTVKDLPTAYAQIGISTVAFAVWVFALGGPFRFLGWYNPVYGSVLVMLFTLVPPLVIGK